MVARNSFVSLLLSLMFWVAVSYADPNCLANFDGWNVTPSGAYLLKRRSHWWVTKLQLCIISHAVNIGGHFVNVPGLCVAWVVGDVYLMNPPPLYWQPCSKRCQKVHHFVHIAWNGITIPCMHHTSFVHFVNNESYDYFGWLLSLWGQ